jgi:hypothetical protein
MALDGIGGGSPLERFQAIRDSAKKKIETTDGQANLADLIKRKQAQMNATGAAGGKMEAGGGASSPASGNAAKASAERIRPGLGAANGAQGAAVTNSAGGAASAGSQVISGPTGYGRAGALQKQESRPTLGRHVDFMA